MPATYPATHGLELANRHDPHPNIERLEHLGSNRHGRAITADRSLDPSSRIGQYACVNGRGIVMCVVTLMAFTGLAACGSSSKSAVPISAKCAAAMKADSTATRVSDTDVGPFDQATLTACTSTAEWLNAVKPYTCDDFDKCIVVPGKFINALTVLSAICHPHLPPQYPACPGRNIQCVMINPPPSDCRKNP
jgi:hypothetical protein